MTAEARRKVIEQVALEAFVERGYQGTSMDEIAKGAGISVPVVYDHFESKRDLHRCLLRKHFDELRGSWHGEISGRYSPEQRLSRSIDAWLSYVKDHPLACRMLFRGITGDPEAEEDRKKMAVESWGKVLPSLPRELGISKFIDSRSDSAEMLFEVLRTGLHGLALWWLDHQQVPRDQVVKTAMNILWIGLHRIGQGERWDS